MTYADPNEHRAPRGAAGGYQYTRTYENQRWYIVGWSGVLLPTDRWAWSDETGKVRLDRDAMSCPSHHAWCGDWECVVDPETTDAEGWTYAVDFPSSAYHPKNFKTACVRRRVWRRPFRLVTEAEQDAILQAAARVPRGGGAADRGWTLEPEGTPSDAFSTGTRAQRAAARDHADLLEAMYSGASVGPLLAAATRGSAPAIKDARFGTPPPLEPARRGAPSQLPLEARAAPDPLFASAPASTAAAADPFAAPKWRPDDRDLFGPPATGSSAAGAADPFAAPPSRPTGPDPFAAPALAAGARDPFSAPPSVRGGPDPFTSSPATAAGSRDPFSAPASVRGGPDPFTSSPATATAPAKDQFAAAAPPRTTRPADPFAAQAPAVPAAAAANLAPLGGAKTKDTEKDVDDLLARFM